MAKADQTEIRLRIIIEQPVAGVLHSLQGKDDHPLDAKASSSGGPLAFDLTVRVGPGPKFFGDQVRREGPVRRFIYIRVGQAAGDPSSPWSRRIKIDIHDLSEDLLNAAAASGRPIEITILGTGKDGTPVAATVRPMSRRIAES